MTSKVAPSIIQIDKENLKSLVSEVKETLAKEVSIQSSVAKQKRFNLTDLWSLQKTVRTAESRRRH